MTGTLTIEDGIITCHVQNCWRTIGPYEDDDTALAIAQLHWTDHHADLGRLPAILRHNQILCTSCRTRPMSTRRGGRCEACARAEQREHNTLGMIA